MFLLLRWWYRRQARIAAHSEMQRINALIEARGARTRFHGFDPALRERSVKRRAAAASIRTRAAGVDSGAPIADVLRRIK